MRALLLIGLGLAACAPPDAQPCQELNAELAACFGEAHASIGCADVSATDLKNLRDGLRLLDCSALSASLPVDGDLLAASCRNLGFGCVEAHNALPPEGATRYPLVLVNGIDDSPLFRYSERILRVLRSRGHAVYLAVDTPYDAPARRAVGLWERVQAVKAETGAEKVNLICHSLGGLDCRYLVSPGGLHWDLEEDISPSVASVTTIATAHRGTRIADVVLGTFTEDERLDGLTRLATFLGETFSGKKLAEDVHLRAALAALSTAQASAWNTQIPDEPSIYYQSWAGFSAPQGLSPPGQVRLLQELCRTDEGDGLGYYHGQYDYMAAPLIPSAGVVGQGNPDYPGEDVPNDGLAPVSSARWGHFRGCIPADHMEQLGQQNLPDANVRTGFDVARFYAEIAADLAGRGL